MIENDKLENYLFIRSKLFRITHGEKFEIYSWFKKDLKLDHGITSFEAIRKVEDINELKPVELLAYTEYLERP